MSVYEVPLRFGGKMEVSLNLKKLGLLYSELCKKIPVSGVDYSSLASDEYTLQLLDETIRMLSGPCQVVFAGSVEGLFSSQREVMDALLEVGKDRAENAQSLVIWCAVAERWKSTRALLELAGSAKGSERASILGELIKRGLARKKGRRRRRA